METKSPIPAENVIESRQELIEKNPHEIEESKSKVVVASHDVEAGEEEREKWDNKLDFMLSCIGYAVGLGNIWRFPYLCYRNGGGAFLIPYVFFLLICGMPLFFLELSFGQFGALGPVSIWKISPIFNGVGWCMLLISFIVCIYYNVIIAYALHFIWNSFTTSLPWASCSNDYNTEFCKEKGQNVTNPPEWTNTTCDAGYGWFDNIGSTIFKSDNYPNASQLAVGATNVTINGSCVMYNTSAQEYFSLDVLKISSGIDETGSINYQLLIALIIAWLVVFLCLFKGVKWSGKVVYFTATFPYIVLIALLIVGVQQEGAMLGIKFYIYPNATRLADVQVWCDAAVQIFYSLGAAWGVLLNYSHMNDFRNNVYRDAMMITTINCGTSVLAGFVVFSVLGSLAAQTGRAVEDVVDQGCGLTFVAYPAAVANLPVAPLWAFLFFGMLLTLGLDSQFGMIEAVIGGMRDMFPWCRVHRVKFIALLCLVQLLLAIPMITQSGIYWVTLIDWYASGIPLMFAAACEIICISWVYGVNRFLYDIKCMIGYKPKGSFWWILTWKFITPACIIILIFSSFFYYTPVKYNGISYPKWGEVIGWMSACISIVCIPGVALYKMYTHPRAHGNFLERIKELSKCDQDWGPKDKDVFYKYNIKQQELLPIKNGEKEDMNSMSWCGKRKEGSINSDSSPPPAYEYDN